MHRCFIYAVGHIARWSPETPEHYVRMVGCGPREITRSGVSCQQTETVYSAFREYGVIITCIFTIATRWDPCAVILVRATRPRWCARTSLGANASLTMDVGSRATLKWRAFRRHRAIFHCVPPVRTRSTMVPARPSCTSLDWCPTSPGRIFWPPSMWTPRAPHTPRCA